MEVDTYQDCTEVSGAAPFVATFEQDLPAALFQEWWQSANQSVDNSSRPASQDRFHALMNKMRDIAELASAPIQYQRKMSQSPEASTAHGDTEEQALPVLIPSFLRDANLFAEAANSDRSRRLRLSQTSYVSLMV